MRNALLNTSAFARHGIANSAARLHRCREPISGQVAGRHLWIAESAVAKPPDHSEWNHQRPIRW